MPPKKKQPPVEQVLLSQAPHQIAVLINGVVQDVIGTPERLAALLLSEPTFEYFNGSSLPKDAEGRGVIAQTRLDEEKNEWVHLDMDGTERREPVNPSPWDVEDE